MKSVHEKLIAKNLLVEATFAKRLCNHTEESFRLRVIMYMARCGIITATAQAKPEVRP